jgi:hypothetical protein
LRRLFGFASAMVCVLASCGRDVRQDKIKEIWTAVDAATQEKASMRALIQLDVMARDSNNEDIARRVDKAKRLIANDARSKCFLLAAITRDAKPTKDGHHTIEVLFYNELGDAKALSVLDRDEREIAGGAIPAETIGGSVKVPCGWIFLFVYPRSATARREFVNGNEMYIREGNEDIAFVQIRDKSGERRDTVRVTPGASLTLKPPE